MDSGAETERPLGQLTDLDESLQDLETSLERRYLDFLVDLEVRPVDSPFGASTMKGTRVNRLLRVVYDRNENNLDKMKGVLASVSLHGATCAIVLKPTKTHVDIFLCTDASGDGSVAGEIFSKALCSNYPGVELEEVRGEVKKEVLNLAGQEPAFLASVTGVPSLKNEDSASFCQGLEKIAEAVLHREMTVLLLAAPVSRCELDAAEVKFQELYSAISPFAEQQMTFSESLGHTLGQTLSSTITSGISQAHTLTKAKTRSDFDLQQALVKAGTGALSGAILASPAGGLGAVPGGVVGGTVGFVQGLFGGSKSETSGETLTKTKQESRGHSLMDSATVQKGLSNQYSVKNKRILHLLELLDEHLTRVRECKNLGMWNWAGYILGEYQSDVESIASIYAGIVGGKRTGIERSAVTVWKREQNEERFTALLGQLMQLKHPLLKLPTESCIGELTPTALISTDELVVAMNLPQKPLPGIPVFDSVEYGRSVCRHRSTTAPGRHLQVGRIYHLGRVIEEQEVRLDVDSLCSHLFITGSTGSGKSTAIYSLLSSLLHPASGDCGVPFLVIEPAKGEYKSVFGGLAGVSVYGTNPYLTPVLRLNPFSFPQNVHVTEHIDRLIEILNAAWPMYAAMPAVLKDAIEKSYEMLGWDLLTSRNKYCPIYPDFYDVLQVLPRVIAESDYSDELKGNYTGSLVTRVRSLTNGYYRSIFTKEELDSRDLFDVPCIVDLSRVGSSETKSLLMGVVFMKLQEHRLSEAGTGSGGRGQSGEGGRLRHITVLEEAHHLLRRTSLGQNNEGANLQGKSVEMISNAIAEMRSYGEGFIVADQSPAMLDPAVIRNTNTKVILRLPDWEDRELVGKAANLVTEQIHELARLRTGCAAVYQNEWQEAVLCQFHPFSQRSNNYWYEPTASSGGDPRESCRLALLQYLLQCRQARTHLRPFSEALRLYGNYFLAPVMRINARNGFDVFLIDCEITALIDIADITKRRDEDENQWLRAVVTQAVSRSKGIGTELTRELIRSMINHFASRASNAEQRARWLRLEEQYV